MTRLLKKNYKEAEPLPVKRKRLEEEKIQNVRKEKATLKIQDLKEISNIWYSQEGFGYEW